MKKVLLINAHPKPGSLNDALAEAYEKGVRETGGEIRTLVLRDLKFDLSFPGYVSGHPPLEDDLRRAQELISWSEHLVFVLPVWWGAWPALLKGFLDRVLMPGYAFRTKSRYSIEKLLKGRSARIITTMDSPNWYYRIVGHPAQRSLKYHTLGFCGIAPVRTMSLDEVKHASPERRGKWLAKVRKIGMRMD